MTGESDGLISDTGVLLDRVRTTLVQLNRDQEPDPSEGLEGHHVAVAASAGDQRSLWNVVGGRQDLPSGAYL